jgi:transmembrane sensor
MDASDRRKRVAAEAAEWWVVLQGEVSRTQREQYVDWLRESAMHVAEMLRIAQVHGALEQFEHWERILTDGSGDGAGVVVTLPTSAQPAPTVPSPRKQTPGRFRLLQSIAAAVLVGVALSAMLIMGFRGQVIQTERGERREVALADGSVVQVDPETRLRVEYEARWRRVMLERGRALFRVAKDPNRPFLVQVRETTVRAVGTAFAVEQHPQSVIVTVAEGKVAVFPVGSPAMAVPDRSHRSDTGQLAGTARQPPRASPQRGAGGPTNIESTGVSNAAGHRAAQILLAANEQVTVDRSGTAEPVREIDSGRVLAWADGRLVFDNDPLDHVIHQFNRYNRIQLYVNDAELARRPISGVFNAADPESFVAFIQSVTAVRVTRNDAADITIDATK